MKLPGALPLPRSLRLPGRLPLRLRVFFRGAFALLALATLALAVTVLRDEKQRSQRNYLDGLDKTQAQIAARLRHPTGQLALLNPTVMQQGATPLRPLLLPFSAIDFDDRAKAQQAVEMAGCLVQYPDAATMCVAVGNNPAAGGFVYVVGSFASGELAAHAPGDLDFGQSHRVRIRVETPEQAYGWIAPFESADGSATRGRLTGFADDVPITPASRPVRDFRGWLWQDVRCLDGGDGAGCARRSFVSVRLPLEVLREALYRRPLVWPPRELAQMRVHVQVLAPGAETPLFDSDAEGARLPLSLDDLRGLLLPGERLHVRRGAQELFELRGAADAQAPIAPWIDALIRRLPVDGADAPLEAREAIATPLGRVDVLLEGDARTVNRNLAAVATRLSGYVAAMLAAVIVTWLAIEQRIIRPLTVLTRRASKVSLGMRAADGVPRIDVSDLQSSDELGVLARGLQDLLQRVHEDVRREQIRAEQEKDMWHAVGHEIVSPLQSLLVLHGDAADPSHRYISRMQQAVRVLYGQASPSEAIAASTLELQPLDLNAFLAHVAANAPHAGIAGVEFEGPAAPVPVRADEYSLEDVVTHLLRNAERHRDAGTPIRIRLAASDGQAQVTVHNRGPQIEPAMLDSVFEYGVSGEPATAGRRGQGLFVAKTYMAKMGGTIAARNVDGGVEFVLTLPC